MPAFFYCLFIRFVVPFSRVGTWLSLVEHSVRDAGVGGSNPLVPTSCCNWLFILVICRVRCFCVPSKIRPTGMPCLKIRLGGESSRWSVSSAAYRFRVSPNPETLGILGAFGRFPSKYSIRMLIHLLLKKRRVTWRNFVWWAMGAAWLSMISATLVSQVHASQTNVDALMNRAYRFYYGKGCAVSYSQAFQLYGQAARLGDPQAQFILGSMYHRGLGTEKNDKEAFKWLLRAAEQGKSTPESENIIGYCYLRGIGVPQNFSEARRWYEMAARHNHVRAQSNLAYIYYNGLGIKPDFAKAFQWYTSAAMQGDSEAQYNLGVMYASGIGTELDRIKAYAWYSLAASGDNAAATTARNELMTDMSWEDLTAAQALSVTLFRQIEKATDTTSKTK